MFAETPSSRPPQLPFKDSPFSIHGRFNRMSYLGGYGLIYLITLIGYFILASFLGSFQLSSDLFNFEFYSSLWRKCLSNMGFLAVFDLSQYYSGRSALTRFK
ncbi:Uncharacterised protein [Acinetobacter baumannii]|nr:Uncharacterised protein [Acinetobacter baumannii]